jgi:antitoxin component YwqK of YwqJK toxin-antitoxin module
MKYMNNTLRISLIFLFVFQLGAILAQKKPGSILPAGKPGVDYNVLDSKGKKQGPWVRQDAKTKMLYYKGQFKDNVPVDDFTFFYTDGSISSIVKHVQDTTINDFIGFHPDGTTKMAEGRYFGKKINGEWKRRKEGMWKFYDTNGVLRTEETYKDDTLNGNSKSYFSSGKPLSDTNYAMGKKEGPFLEWWENGLKKSEGTYTNDVIHGPMTMYTEKGKKEAEGSYENGLKQGRWVSYHPTGSVELQVKYDKGKEIQRRYENGTFMEYYPSGIPKSEYTFEQGKKNGPFTEWHDVGSFENQTTTYEEQQQGIMMRQKLVGTQINMQGDYLDDFLEGEIKFYDEKGKLIKTEIWSDGELKETKK